MQISRYKLLHETGRKLRWIQVEVCRFSVLVPVLDYTGSHAILLGYKFILWSYTGTLEPGAGRRGDIVEVERSWVCTRSYRWRKPRNKDRTVNPKNNGNNVIIYVLWCQICLLELKFIIRSYIKKYRKENFWNKLR